MRKRIKLRSHDGSKNCLVYRSFKNDYYEFILKTQYSNIRVISEEKVIVAVDPPGGPMISVGDNDLIIGMILSKIDFVKDVGCVLYFKSISHDSGSRRRH